MRKSPFTAEQIAEFHRIQALRPVVLKRFGDLLEIWRGCGNAPCIRARSCQRGGSLCLGAFMGALPDAERRLLLYALEFRSHGLDAGEAIERARARVRDEIARFGE